MNVQTKHQVPVKEDLKIVDVGLRRNQQANGAARVKAPRHWGPRGNEDIIAQYTLFSIPISNGELQALHCSVYYTRLLYYSGRCESISTTQNFPIPCLG
jgi:hypothetical protein